MPTTDEVTQALGNHEHDNKYHTAAILAMRYRARYISNVLVGAANATIIDLALMVSMASLVATLIARYDRYAGTCWIALVGSTEAHRLHSAATTVPCWSAVSKASEEDKMNRHFWGVKKACHRGRAVLHIGG